MRVSRASQTCSGLERYHHDACRRHSGNQLTSVMSCSISACAHMSRTFLFRHRCIAAAYRGATLSSLMAHSSRFLAVHRLCRHKHLRALLKAFKHGEVDETGTRSAAPSFRSASMPDSTRLRQLPNSGSLNTHMAMPDTGAAYVPSPHSYTTRDQPALEYQAMARPAHTARPLTAQESFADMKCPTPIDLNAPPSPSLSLSHLPHAPMSHHAPGASLTLASEDSLMRTNPSFDISSQNSAATLEPIPVFDSSALGALHEHPDEGSDASTCVVNETLSYPLSEEMDPILLAGVPVERRTGSDVRRTGSDVRRTGSDVQRSGLDVQRAVAGVQRTGSDAPGPVGEAAEGGDRTSPLPLGSPQPRVHHRHHSSNYSRLLDVRIDDWCVHAPDSALSPTHASAESAQYQCADPSMLAAS